MISEMSRSDFENFWPSFSNIIQAEETYALDPDMNLEQSYNVWCNTPLKTYAFIESGIVLGTYYIKPNGMGPAKHICNCGFMVSNRARGRGVAREMCEHSQDIAKKLGFEAMQFNGVVSTNEKAVKLWLKLGFDIIGRVPRAYRHGQLGYVDTLIMYKWLQP